MAVTGAVKIQRIQRKFNAEMNLLGSVLRPEVLHEAVPRLATVAEARREYRSKMLTIQALAPDKPGSQGFDPTRKIWYVAQVDQSVWAAILEVFGKVDNDNQPLDDGTLYVRDDRGAIRLNRDFFFALIDFLQACGYEVDMRTSTRLT
jgi:hypothetical protein